MILVQQRKQAKIGFETFRSKYIKLCVSSDVGKKEIRSERKRTCFLRRGWVVHLVHEAEQTRAAPENENITAVA